MNTPTDLQIWLQEQAWPLAIIALLVLGAYVGVRYSASRRRKTLNEERSGVSEETFTTYLSTQRGLDPLICGATYRYLQQVQRVDFPILPTDFLDDDLGLGHEDIEQCIRELASALRRELSPGQERTAVLSVEDLVRLLQACPALSRSVAA